MAPWYWNPEWWQVILIVAGTMVATAAFLADRRAIRLTQRADILLSGHELWPARSEILHHRTSLRLTYKNYGPTRAMKVRFNPILSAMGVDGTGDIRVPIRDVIPPVVLGAGEAFPIDIPLGELFDSSTHSLVLQGKLVLRFTCEVKYEDVFGQTHRTSDVGRYARSDDRIVHRFEVEQNEAD